MQQIEQAAHLTVTLMFAPLVGRQSVLLVFHGQLVCPFPIGVREGEGEEPPGDAGGKSQLLMPAGPS